MLTPAQLLWNWYEHHPSKQNDLDSSVIGRYEKYITWGGATFDFCSVLLFVIVLWLHFNRTSYITKWSCCLLLIIIWLCAILSQLIHKFWLYCVWWSLGCTVCLVHWMCTEDCCPWFSFQFKILKLVYCMWFSVLCSV